MRRLGSHGPGRIAIAAALVLCLAAVLELVHDPPGARPTPALQAVASAEPAPAVSVPAPGYFVPGRYPVPALGSLPNDPVTTPTPASTPTPEPSPTCPAGGGLIARYRLTAAGCCPVYVDAAYRPVVPPCIPPELGPADRP